MKKRILSVILVVCMMFSIMPGINPFEMFSASAAQGDSGDSDAQTPGADNNPGAGLGNGAGNNADTDTDTDTDTDSDSDTDVTVTPQPVLPPEILLEQNKYDIKYNDFLQIDIKEVSTDPQNLELFFEISAQPETGSADIDIEGIFTYVPDTESTAKSETITIAAGNGTEQSEVTITVNIYAPPIVPETALELTLAEDTDIETDLADPDISSDPRGHELVYAIKTQPQHGTAGLTEQGLLTYTPDADYNGEDTIDISLRHKNADLYESTFSVIFCVTPVEDAPLAEDDGPVYVKSNAPEIIIDVLKNDKGIDSDELVIAIAAAPSKAKECYVTDDNMICYKPNPRQSGTDTFTYKVIHKGGTLAAEATVTVYIEAENDRHRLEVEADEITIYEDELLEFTFTLIDIDSDFDDFDVTIVSGDTKVFRDGVYTQSYTDGTDIREYTIKWQPVRYANTPSDPVELTIIATDFNNGGEPIIVTQKISVTVIPVNNEPIAVDDAYVTEDYDAPLEDTLTTLDVLKNDIEHDGIETVTIIAAGTGSRLGGVSVNGVTEGRSGEPGTAGTVRIVSQADVDAGLAKAEDIGRKLLYLAAENYFGPDGFWYTIEDDYGLTSTAYVRIVVQAVNDLPVILPDFTPGEPPEGNNYVSDKDYFLGLEDNELRIRILVDDIETNNSALMLQAAVASDGDPDSVTLRVYVETVNPEEPDVRYVRYVPAPDQHNTGGTVTLKLTLSDGFGKSDYEIDVYIAPVNDAPVATDKEFSFDEYKPDSDPEDLLFISIAELMKDNDDVDIKTNKDSIEFDYTYDINATLSQAGASLIYGEKDGKPGFYFLPVAHSEETLTFKYRIKDNGTPQLTAVATVTLRPITVNDAPYVDAITDAGDVPIQEPVAIYIQEDSENNIIKITYGDYETTDNKDLKISIGSSQPTIISTAGLRFIESSGDDKTGILYITPLRDKYTADDEPVIVTLSISDGERMTPVQISVYVEPVPDTPRAVNDFYDAIADRESILTPLDNDFDVDDEEITIIGVVDMTDKGADIDWDPDTGVIRFKAPEGFEGIYTLHYTIQDTSTYIYNKATGIITISVTAFGTDPVIEALSGILVTVGLKEPRNIVLHNVPDEYTLTVISENQAILPNSALSIGGQGNTAVFDGGVGEQTHELAITVPDSVIVSGSTFIVITLTHGTKTDSIRVPVTVKRTNDAPEAVNDVFTINEGATASLDVLANDTDDQHVSNLVIFSVTQPAGHGIVNIAQGGKSITYTPTTSNSRYYFFGTVTFTYTVMDLGGKTDTASVTINVLPMPTRPLAVDDYFEGIIEIDEDKKESIVIYGRDVIIIPEPGSEPEGEPEDEPESEPEGEPEGEPKSIAGVLTNDRDYDDNYKGYYTSDTPAMDTAVITWNEDEVFIYTGTDTDGRPLTETELGQIDIRIDGENLIFTPLPGIEGWYRFKYSFYTLNVIPEDADPDVWNPSVWISGDGDTSNSANVYIAVSRGSIIPPSIDDGYYERAEFRPNATPPDTEAEVILNVNGLVKKFNDTEPLSVVTYSVSQPAGNKILSDFIMEINEKGEAVFRYTRNPYKYGTVTIKWKVKQGDSGNSNEGTITLVITNINDAPVIDNIGVTAPYIAAQGETETVYLEISDVDHAHSDIRTRVNSDADHIIPSDAITLVHAPEPGFPDLYKLTFISIDSYGLEDFAKRPIVITIQATDGRLHDEKSFEVFVEPQNNPPVVFFDAENPYKDVIFEDTQGEYNAAFLGSDKDGNAIMIVFDPDGKAPDTGIFYYKDGVYYENTDGRYGGVYLTARDMKLNYYPAKDFYTAEYIWPGTVVQDDDDDGEDDAETTDDDAETTDEDIPPDNDFIEIRYRLSDGELISDEIGYIRLKIHPVNDAPEIYGLFDSYQMLEDKPDPVTFKVRDVDTYDFAAAAEITWSLSDSDDSAEAPISPLSKYIKSCNVKTIKPVSGSDNEYEVTLEFVFYDDIHHDDLDIGSRTFITITISDGSGGVATAEFSIKITEVNDPVFPREDITIPNSDVPYLTRVVNQNGKTIYFLQIDEDEDVYIDIVKLFDDIDGSPSEIFLASLSDIRQGTAVNRSNRVYFKPVRDHYHPDALQGDTSEDAQAKLAKFDFTVMDLYGASYESTAYIFIKAVNDDPVTPNFNATAIEDTPVYITPILADESRVRDVDNDLSELTITNATVLDGKGEVFIVPKYKDIFVEYTDNNGLIEIVRKVYVTSSYPYQRLYYIPGIDENSPDHGPATGNGAMRIKYTVSDNVTAPHRPGSSEGTISVYVASVHDTPRLNLEVDTLWMMYEDNEFRYDYRKNALDENEENQSPFGLRMWTPELYKDLSLVITSYDYNDNFWNAWTSSEDGGDISGFTLIPHRTVVRGENTILTNTGQFGPAVDGWFEVHLIPELNKSGELILQLVLDDGTEKTTTYVKVIVIPVNDVPVAIPQIIAGEGDKYIAPEGTDPGKYTYTINERESLTRTVTGTDVETDTQLLTYRAPDTDDDEIWNTPAYPLSALQPKNGRLDVYKDGDIWCWTYTPDAYFYGTDYFYIIVQDSAITVQGHDLDAENGFTLIEVTVKNVNDPPSKPAITGTDKGAYKDGDKITVYFTPSTDYFDTRSETKDDELLYTIEVSYNGSEGPWYKVLDEKTVKDKTGDEYYLIAAEEGLLSYTFAPPYTGANTDDFLIRVYAKDTVVDGAEAKVSETGYSSLIKIDNTAPELSHILISDSYTSEDVDIVLTVTDTAAGATGVDSVYLVDEHGEIIAVLYDSGSGGDKTVEATHTVDVNGTYYFKAVDKIGHISEIYTVEVLKIDKLYPVTTASVNSISFGDNKYADSGVKIELTYSDAAADEDNCKSDVITYSNQRQYILDNKSPAPPADDSAWTDYEGAISLKVKGQWYIHAKAADLAGNVTVNTYGPYEINNTPPESSGKTVTVYEYKSGVYSNFTDIDIKSLVTDPDNPGDIASINIISMMDEDYGTWTELWDTSSANPHEDDKYGWYRFTHSGKGDYPFKETLTVTFSVTDFGDVAGGVTVFPGQTSNISTITINVIELNDAPSIPEDIRTDNVRYTDKDKVELRWDASADEEETSDALYYEVEVSYYIDGTGKWTEWSLIHTTEAGVTAYDFPVPGDLTGIMKFRVRAVDNGKGADGLKELEIMKSGWAESDEHNLDNDAPAVVHKLSAQTFTKEPVTVTLTITEQRDGDTGIVSVEYIGDIAIIDGQFKETGSILTGDIKTLSTHTFTAYINGVYKFRVTDEVGNTDVYTVTIDIIDKLDPGAAADIESIDLDTGIDNNNIKVYAKEKSVTLTYWDAPASDIYSKSGVSLQQYVLTEIADPSDVPEPKWVTLDNAKSSVDILLHSKGEWYIHYRVEDAAGNDAADTFGPYQINNSSPIARDSKDNEFIVWEHDLGNDEHIITVNLRELTTDVDGDDDIVRFVVTEDPAMADCGMWEGDEETGVYTFTHDGTGNPFTAEFKVSYYAIDSDDCESLENNKGKPNVITITVREVNDAPSAPVSISPAAGSYKDGDTVTLTWLPVSDEETKQDDIIYEIEVSYDAGVSWSSAGATEPGVTLFNFEISKADTGGKNGILCFRVWAVDGGYNADGTQGALAAETSAKTQSPGHNLDNTPPHLEYELESADDTDKDVVITITVTDDRIGDTGIYSVESVYVSDEEPFVPVDISSDDCRIYTLTVKYNGVYKFIVTDNIGNEKTYEVVVENIDKLPPSVSADPPHLIGIENAVYSQAGATVKLTYSDADKTLFNNKSGIKTVEYIMETTSTKPAADDDRWEVYNSLKGIPLNKKGVWYIFVKVADNAGNEIIERFGTYLVLNHNPVAWDGAVTICEHDLGDDDNCVIINFFDYSDDPDGKSDIVLFDIDASDAMRLGTWEELDFGIYRYTYGGYGKYPFTEELKVTFIAVDNDGNNSTEGDDETVKPAAVITIKITEVNDNPEAPSGITPLTGVYKDGDKIELTWTEAEDEETDVAKLRYEIEVSYNNGLWSAVAVTAAGAVSYEYTIPVNKYNGTMRFRIRTVDDGCAADGITVLDVTGKTSDWELSPVYTIDNKAPVISHETDPDTYTAGNVTIILTVTDTGDGASGIKSVSGKSPSGAVLTISVSNGKYYVTAAANGIYTFTAEDNAGNKAVYTAEIDIIDRLAPVVYMSAVLPSGRYDSPVSVSLVYSDSSDADNVKSGTDIKKYALVKSTTAPAATSGDWKDYESAFAIEKGVWYLYAMVTDKAGNITVESFGMYFMHIDGPEAMPDGYANVSEHITSQGGSENEVVIDLRELIIYDGTDKDELVYTLIPSAELIEHGTLTGISEGVYKFIHNGNGNPFVSELTFTFKAIDTDSVESGAEIFTIYVTEVNDTPAAPAGLDPQSGAYKDTDSISLSWADAVDEETPADDIIYRIEVSIDGDPWVYEADTAAGVTAYEYLIDYSGNGTVRFSITAFDDGRGSDGTALGAPEQSNPLVSPAYIIDNTPPSALTVLTSGDNAYTPGEQAIEEVDVTISFDDEGGAGLCIFGYALTFDENPPADLSGYIMFTEPEGNQITTPATGSYYLHLYAVDKAGNEYIETVNPPDEPIDVLNTRPVALPQTVSTDIGSSIEIILEGFDNDIDDEITAYTIVTDVLYGTLIQKDGSNNIFIYTHDESELAANDIFTFIVTDTFGINSKAAVVSIDITTPAATPAPVETPEATPEVTPEATPAATPAPVETPEATPGADTTTEATPDTNIPEQTAQPQSPEPQQPEETPVPQPPQSPPPVPGTDGSDTPQDEIIDITIPDTPVSGVNVFKYGHGMLTLVVQSAENSDIHQKSMVTLVEPHAAIVSILSKEELEQVLHGAHIEVKVQVDYIRYEAHKEDKILIENAIGYYSDELEGLTLGEYLDITVAYRFIGGEYKTVTQTDGDIKLCIDIAKDLRKINAESHYIFRSHDGAATILFDIDENPETITFETDCFSIYADAYVKKAPGTQPCVLCGHCRQLLGICIYIWLTAFITVTAAAVYTSSRNRRYRALEKQTA